MAELTELGKNACAAKYILQKLTTEEKNKALDTAANYLCDRQAEVSLLPMSLIWRTAEETE